MSIPMSIPQPPPAAADPFFVGLPLDAAADDVDPFLGLPLDADLDALGEWADQAQIGLQLQDADSETPVLDMAHPAEHNNTQQHRTDRTVVLLTCE